MAAHLAALAAEPERPDVSRAMLEERWKTLTIGVMQSDASETNSGLMRRWMADTRQLAARMVHGVDEVDSEEYSALCRLENDLLVELERAVFAFAEAIEAGRAGK